jgi:transcriptional regulator with XRE-family HTH domain
MNIGMALREARIAAGLQQKELARLMGIHPSFLSDLEKGNRTFHDRYVDRLPDVIRVPVAAALVAEHEAQIRCLMKE